MYSLIIDKEFSSLIAPLSEMEFRFLEASIRKDGCREPITIWHNIIIDGHNRYRICLKWNIPFQTEEKHFNDRVEAVAWICSKQLGRRNISEETRKYLIGRQFDAEKIIHKRKMAAGASSITMPITASKDEHAPSTSVDQGQSRLQPKAPRKNPTAGQIGDEHHISHSTVEKYALYSRALDVIGQASPSLQERILSGKCKLSYTNVIMLSRMEPSAVCELAEQLDAQKEPDPFIPYRHTREALSHVKSESGTPEIHTEIKQMPKPDPDADINRLALTVSAWVTAMKKSQPQLAISSASTHAKSKLIEALYGLSACIHTVLQMIEGREPHAE